MASKSDIDVELGLNEEKKSKDELHFQDFPLEEDELDTSDGQTHKFTNFPHTADSDEDISDKSELLKDDKAITSFWKFEYYQQFFDVDSKQVFHRVAGSMLPLPNRNYLVTHIRPNPDLYGPFWICLTLVFTTAIAGNLANYLQSASVNYVWKYDFHKVSLAATAIFSYWWLIPLFLYGILWWRGNQTSVRYTFLEIICVYGYSLAIYIPISILWVIQVNWLQWILVIIGAVLSGSVLIITFWPAVKDDTKHVALTILAVIFIFHAALAIGFVLYFFHVPAATSSVPSSTISPVNTTTKVFNNLHSRTNTQQHDSNPAPVNAIASGDNLPSKNKTGTGTNISNKPSSVKSTSLVKPEGTKIHDRLVNSNSVNGQRHLVHITAKARSV